MKFSDQLQIKIDAVKAWVATPAEEKVVKEFISELSFSLIKQASAGVEIHDMEFVMRTFSTKDVIYRLWCEHTNMDISDESLATINEMIKLCINEMGLEHYYEKHLGQKS